MASGATSAGRPSPNRSRKGLVAGSGQHDVGRHADRIPARPPEARSRAQAARQKGKLRRTWPAVQEQRLRRPFPGIALASGNVVAGVLAGRGSGAARRRPAGQASRPAFVSRRMIDTQASARRAARATKDAALRRAAPDGRWCLGGSGVGPFDRAAPWPSPWRRTKPGWWAGCRTSGCTRRLLSANVCSCGPAGPRCPADVSWPSSFGVSVW